MSNDSSFSSTVNIANGVAVDDNPVRYIFCRLIPCTNEYRSSRFPSAARLGFTTGLSQVLIQITLEILILVTLEAALLEAIR